MKSNIDKMKRKFFLLIGGTTLVVLMTINIGIGVKAINGNCTLSSIIKQSVAYAESPGGGYSCSAKAQCYIGGEVSCTGTDTCTSGIGYVKCDGKTSSCVKY